jgi:hypothetical protein
MLSRDRFAHIVIQVIAYIYPSCQSYWKVPPFLFLGLLSLHNLDYWIE